MARSRLRTLAVLASLFLATFSFIGPVGATATTYFISPTGSDSNACTLASPCLTLNHFSAASYGGSVTLNPGDVVYMLPGTYTADGNTSDFPGFEKLQGVSGTAINPITVTTSPTTPAKIVNGTVGGSVTATGMSNPLLGVVADDHVTFKNIHIVGPKLLPGYASGNPATNGTVNMQASGDTTGYNSFINMTIAHATGSGCIKDQDGLPHILYDNNTFIDCGDTNNTQDHAIYASGPYATVANNVISGTTGYGVHIRGVGDDNAIVYNNVIHDTTMSGFYTDGQNTSLISNTIYYAANGCMQLDDPNGDTIEQNVCYGDGASANHAAFMEIDDHSMSNDLIAYNTVDTGTSCANYSALIFRMAAVTSVTLEDNIFNAHSTCYNAPYNSELSQAPTFTTSSFDYNDGNQVRPIYACGSGTCSGGTNYDGGHSLTDVDPSFVGGTVYPTGLTGDPGMPDLHLNSGSGVCNAGVSLAGAPGSNPLTLGAYSC